MPARMLALAGAALLVAGCVTTAGDTTTSIPPASTTGGAAGPADAVRAWMAAAGDPAGPLPVVDDTQLALLVAVDNSLGTKRTAALVDGALSDEVRRGFWDSFAASFESFAGVPVGGLQIGEIATYRAAGADFAAVTVVVPGGEGSTDIIAALNGELWRVDLMATMGPRLVRPLRELFEAAGDDAAGRTVRAALAGSVPSLQAAVQRPQADLSPEFVAETEALIELLDPAGSA